MDIIVNDSLSLVTTVLLAPKSWNYVLPNDDQISRDPSMFEPLLPELFNVSIEIRLDRPVYDAGLRLLCQVNYPRKLHILGYRPRELDQCLKREHKQFHYDTLADVDQNPGVLQCHAHKVRDAIGREEQCELQDIASASDHEGFVTTRK